MKKIQMPNFEQANVLVVGDVMLDRYWHGGNAKISKEAPVQVLNVEQIDDKPGGAGNVALNISSLGSKVDLVSNTGDDDSANILHTRLTAAKVNCHFKRVDGIKTTTKLRVLSQKQQLMRLDFEEHLHRRGIDDLSTRLKENIARSGAVVFSDYAKGLLEDVQTLIQVAKEYKIPILVDPKGSDFSRYRGATLVTPNLKEFEEVVGPCIDEHQLVEKGKKAIRE
ncbi:MAG: PfkB family carbohydrate kinase, partial [Gammaproteobacteria bacterium]|nr:PfkB family carbohydrate kinase [Gammaproteobacteria bacterium]